MSDKLKGLFGGGEAGDTGHADDRDARRAERRAERQKLRDLTDDENDFVNRYTTGNPSEGFSTEEAVNYLQRVRGEVPPEVLQRAAVTTVQNLPADQRKQFAEMLERRRQGTGMVTIERSGQAGAAQGRGGGDAGGMDDVLGGLFGSLMGGGTTQPAPQHVPQGGGQGDDMLGGLLGSLFGGGGSPSSQSQGGDPFGDLFGGLMGGGAQEPTQRRQTPQAQQQQPGGGIGDMLGSPLGKAVLGGIAAFAMKEMMDGNRRR
jgi:hypothetical protein